MMNKKSDNFHLLIKKHTGGPLLFSSFDALSLRSPTCKFRLFQIMSFWLWTGFRKNFKRKIARRDFVLPRLWPPETAGIAY